MFSFAKKNSSMPMCVAHPIMTAAITIFAALGFFGTVMAVKKKVNAKKLAGQIKKTAEDVAEDIENGMKNCLCSDQQNQQGEQSQQSKNNKNKENKNSSQKDN